MAVVEIGALGLNVSELPELLRRHRQAYPSTPDVEALGLQLVASDFDHGFAIGFVREVCRWGGYAGIGGRVVKNNEPRLIGGALREGHTKAILGRSVEGLRSICSLRGLSKPSFASKHLRFLAPQAAVILDSVISESLGYRYDFTGYQTLLDDCHRATALVIESGIAHPFRAGPWFVSDLEMAAFAKLRNL